TRGEFTRRVLAPLLMIVATRFGLSRRAIFRFISQTRIHYPESPLSEGTAGDVAGGDRLPWVRKTDVDNFAPLRSLNWQVHVYGEIEETFRTVCCELGLRVYTFPWTQAVANIGFKHDAAYLIRPDGYVALASPKQDHQKLKGF